MKNFFKTHIFLTTVLTSIIIFVVFGTISVISSRYFYYHIHHNIGEHVSNISVDISNNILVLDSIDTYDRESIVRLKSICPGNETLFISYNIESNGELITIEEERNVIVNKTRMIFVGNKLFDYTGFSVMYYSFMIYSGLMTLFFYWLRKECQKEAYYSFNSINMCSATLFFFVIFLVYFFTIFTAYFTDYLISTEILILITKNFMMAFSALTIPFMTLFYLSLAISNIALIRHEGKKITNMLGIGIALAIACGTGINAYLFFKNLKFGADNPALSVTYTTYSALFSIFHVMLLGAIISCLEAAYRKVSFDKKYIIILGCSIRKDGTLYPLIQGRVDRAISFWKEQYVKTGMRAFFVPSGGQGNDEVMPEATAMEKYLSLKGIPQEYIIPETNSSTTFENMKFSKNIIDDKEENATIVFSTTNYHVFRSGILASQAGLSAEGIGSRTKWYFWPNAMIREVIGMFAVQTKLQWIVTTVLILLAGLFEYLYIISS